MQEINWLLKEKYNGKRSSSFDIDVKRIVSGEPVGYVIGSVPFLGCTIDVKKRPLLPRAETEWWTKQAIVYIQEKNKQSDIICLDIFAGSGCIGLALLKHIPTVTLDFAERNPTLLLQIATNVRCNAVDPRRVSLHVSDVFSTLSKTRRYHYIFANPPYISTNRRMYVDQSVLKWEPYDALFAEKDGLEYLDKTIKEAPEYLYPEGTLFMEFDSCQKKSIELLFKRHTDMYSKVKFWRDQYKKWRVVVATKK